MSIRQPVSRAASRAFWPSRPIASESIRSGTVTLAIRCSSSMSTEMTWAGLSALATRTLGVIAPGDHVDLLARQLGDDGLDTRAALADGRADRVKAILSGRHGDLGSAAGLTGDRLDLDGPAVDLGDLELEQALEEALVRSADEDLRALRRAPDLEHERLDVLSDAVVLERGLLGRGEDRLDVLADVEDDRARFDTVDRAGHELTLAARELVEDLVALDLADALEHDLLGRLGADAAEDVAIELLGLHQVADLGARLVRLGLLQGHLCELVLHLADDAARAKDADLAGLGIDPHMDVLVTGDATVRGLDAVLDGADQLFAGDLLFGVELEEGTDEVSTHDGLRSLHVQVAPLKKKRGGHPRHRSGRSVAAKYTPGSVDAQTVRLPQGAAIGP